MTTGGKGSSPRPYSVDQKTFNDNWDRIFKNKEKEASLKNNKETQPNTQQKDKNGTTH